MRVLNYPEFDRLEVRDLDATPPRPDEVSVKVAACGLCGSELETFKNHSPRRQPPLVMGHEFCGVIAELGAETKVVATGGLAKLIASGSKYVSTVDDMLTLTGLRIVYQRNLKAKR